MPFSIVSNQKPQVVGVRSKFLKWKFIEKFQPIFYLKNELWYDDVIAVKS